MRVPLVVVALLLLAGGLIYLATSGVSCEDRGLQTRLSRYQPIFNGTTVILVPIYTCEASK